MSDLGNTPEIDFKVNPIYSCYCLWSGTLNGMESAEFDKKRREFISSFKSPEISGLVDATIPWGHKNTLSNIQKVQGIIGAQNVQNIDDLQKVLTENFDKDNAEQLTAAIKKALPKFEEFLSQNKNVIENDLQVLSETQKVYGKELSALYTCFGVDESKQGVMFVNPSPVKPMSDGISTSLNASMNYSLKQDENSDNYLEGSNILSRKASTPFHETTHFLFNNSKVKKELTNATTLGTKKIMDWLTAQFDTKPEEKRVGPDSKQNAIGAMNEAFAVCATALYNEKTTGQPIQNGDKWYHGFEMPNRLAPVMYPLFKEYVEQGRPFDDKFYETIYQKMKNKERLNSLRKRLSGKTEIIPAKRSARLTLNANDAFMKLANAGKKSMRL